MAIWEHMGPSEEQLLLNRFAIEVGRYSFFDSLEDLLSSPDGFGLTTVTPLQRAVCRVIDGSGLRDLERHEKVVEALGTYDYDSEVEGQPGDVVIVAGIRTGKSIIAAATAIWASQTCSLEELRDGEIARYSILSLELDNARVVLGHLLGALQKPRLQALRVNPKEHAILDEIGADVVGSEFLRHPSGRVVEVRVVAGKRAGGSLVSRWSFGLSLDEAPRMLGSTEGVINYDDARRAVKGRLVEGGQILSIGSPWQPYGPIYDIVQNEWSKPTRDRVVIRAKGPDLNPQWWSEERCRDIKRSDPKAYQTEVLAEFADEEEAIFTQALLAKCTRKERGALPHAVGHDYVAAIDPATRGNAFTLVVGSRRGRVKKIVFNKEWKARAGEVLSPRAVLREVRDICARYKLSWAFTDQWAADAMRDIGYEEGFNLVDIDWTQQETVDTYTSLAAAMADGTVEVPPDPMLQKDLKLLKKKATNRGFSIHLPTTPDGRHCDYAPALARCLKQWIDDEKTLPPKRGEDGYVEYVETQMRDKFERQMRARQRSMWDTDVEAEQEIFAIEDAAEERGSIMEAARELMR